MSNRHIRSLVFYGLGIAVLFFLIWWNWKPSSDGKWPGLANLLRMEFHWQALAIGAGCFLVALLFQFVRWFVLVRAQDLPFTFVNAIRLGLIGFFFNSVLPAGSVGGDLVKAAFIAKEQTRRTVAVSTVLIDRATGLWGLIWLAFLAGAIFWAADISGVASEPRMRSIIVILGAILAGTVVVWLSLGLLPQRRADKFAGRLSRIPKIGHSAAEFWRAIWMYRLKRSYIGLALLLTIGAHICFVLSFYFAAHIFQEPGKPIEVPSLAQHFLIVPICSASQAFIPLPGGIGAGEGMYGGFYSLLGFEEGYGFLACFVQRVIIIYGWSIIGYFVYLQMRPALAPVKKSASDEPESAEVALDSAR